MTQPCGAKDGSNSGPCDVPSGSVALTIMSFPPIALTAAAIHGQLRPVDKEENTRHRERCSRLPSVASVEPTY